MTKLTVTKNSHFDGGFSSSRLPAACGFIAPPARLSVEIRLRPLRIRRPREQHGPREAPEQEKELLPEPGFYTPVPAFFWGTHTERGQEES